MKRFIEIIRELSIDNLNRCSHCNKCSRPNYSLGINLNIYFTSNKKSRKLVRELFEDRDNMGISYHITCDGLDNFDYNKNDNDNEHHLEISTYSKFSRQQVIFVDEDDLINYSIEEIMMPQKNNFEPTLSYPFYLCDCDKMNNEVSHDEICRIKGKFYNKLYKNMQDQNDELSKLIVENQSKMDKLSWLV